MTLKELCKSKDKTFTDIAEKTGISINYLSQLNTGKKKNPSLDLVSKISNQLKVSIEDVKKTIKN